MVPCSKSSLLIRLSKSRCFTCLLQHLYLLQFVCLFNLSLLFFAHVSLSFALGPSINQVDMERGGVSQQSTILQNIYLVKFWSLVTGCIVHAHKRRRVKISNKKYPRGLCMSHLRSQSCRFCRPSPFISQTTVFAMI